MRAFIQRFCIALFLVFLSGFLFAQEKTQAYYNTHEHEILPDARTAFQNGKYTRAIELCNWHYIIIGDNAADSLREKAEQCAQLSTKMIEFRSAEQNEDAVATAKSLLSLNPDDPVAKELLEELEKTDVPVPVDTMVVDVPVLTDTLVIEKPLEELPNNDITQEPDPTDTHEDVVPLTSTQIEPDLSPDSQPRTRFVIKAGASVLDLKQFSQTIAPGASLGVYDMGGSPVGLEAGFYLCPGLSAQSASLFGIDASFVFRAAKGIYPMAGLGFFSCSSAGGADAATKGLCAGLGLTFLVGGHFCIEVGAKYYPTVKLRGSEMVSTSGVSYEFPAAIQILAGGVAPMISFGWAF